MFFVFSILIVRGATKKFPDSANNKETYTFAQIFIFTFEVVNI